MRRARLATVSAAISTLLIAGSVAPCAATAYVVSGTQLSLRTHGTAMRGAQSSTLRDPEQRAWFLPVQGSEIRLEARSTVRHSDAVAK